MPSVFHGAELSSQLIGTALILNNKHFVFTANKEIEWFGGSTHKRAWEAMDLWARQPRHGIEVVRCFSSLGLTGEDWASATGATIATVGEYWVNNWSIDLHSLNSDKELRNDVSYRPNLRANAFALVSESDLRFVRDISEASSPVDFGQFDVIDRAVINDLCKKSYKLLYDPPQKTSLTAFWGAVVEWVVSNKAKSNAEALEIVRSIRKASEASGGNIVSRAARKKGNVTGVFSRAFLLLRLSSALLRTQWQEARRRNPPQEWQDNLISDYAHHSLLCNQERLARDLTVLGSDQELAIERLDDWIGTNRPFDAYELWKSESEALVNLCRFERVGALAVAL